MQKPDIYRILFVIAVYSDIVFNILGYQILDYILNFVSDNALPAVQFFLKLYSEMGARSFIGFRVPHGVPQFCLHVLCSRVSILNFFFAFQDLAFPHSLLQILLRVPVSRVF